MKVKEKWKYGIKQFLFFPFNYALLSQKLNCNMQVIRKSWKAINKLTGEWVQINPRGKQITKEKTNLIIYSFLHCLCLILSSQQWYKMVNIPISQRRKQIKRILWLAQKFCRQYLRLIWNQVSCSSSHITLHKPFQLQILFTVAQRVCVCALSHFSRVQLFATLWTVARYNPMNCSLPGSSVHGLLQARTLEWVAMPSSRGSSWPGDWTHVSYVSCIGRWVLFH